MNNNYLIAIKIMRSIINSTLGLVKFMILCSIFLLFTFCNKLVDIDNPITSVNADLVYKSDATAIATLNNIYKKMSQQGITSGLTSISLYTGLSADELNLFDDVTDPVYISFYKNDLTSSISGGVDYWTNLYSSYIFSSNAIIEGLTASKDLTPTVKDQLLGEALFIRSFCYFYLINLYGDVPLVLTTDYKQNSQVGRSKTTDVYKQIISDLKKAKNLLNDNYLDATLLNVSIERTAPNKSAAIALLSRVYLFTEEWKNAESQADEIINNKVLYDTVSIADVFLANNKESIWQLQSVSNFITNTSDAMLFYLPSTGPSIDNYKVVMNKELVFSMNENDERKIKWTDSVITDNATYYYPTKYKINTPEAPVTEQTVVLRLSEQYLIRAEARLKLNELSGAISDINVIRNRAGLSPFISMSKNDILNEIIFERRVELFTEWGHRWLDLKRLNIADQTLQPLKNNTWQPTDKLYPIPLTDILKNVSLNDNQNPGY